ncbi:hypothetical protein GALMADRAFT_250902 [Galerina marginata CBS 339.88]|uniref:Uncharacterized protein n=1 Tax=Galerina marginata (strain CBS 339.88) TaxID=685588 RepID=A0A067SVL9_GALM3|nr:hypothetical protein GALMADRAFT_250902 [Galerina marginata CBS 339.88]
MYHPIFSRQGLRVKASSAYARITLNRFTTAFFLFSFIYCFIQGIIQSLLYSADFEYSTLISGIVSQAEIPFQNLTYLEGSAGKLILRMCDDIPHGQAIYPCFPIFNSTADSPKYNGSSAQMTPPQLLQGWENGLSVTKEFDPLNTTEVTSLTLGLADATEVKLSKQCTQILVYPSQILRNMRREDISWICLQFWLLAISFIAILNDSVPHILAVLMTRALSTGWAMYAIWRAPYFRDNFQELLADPGTPCSIDVFSAFWEKRQGFEIADLILSTTGLVFFSYLSWTLLKIYNGQSFKCVGAPDHVMRIHKFFMAVLACLQLEAFVLVTGMGLWTDVLMNTAIAKISAHTTIYQALFIFTTIFLIPWIVMGWYSIRREMKKMMVFFLAIGFCIISGWAIMFYSIVYRWSFMQWPFLGCFTVASFILLISSMTLGVVCRVNFGKGLAQYLHAESTLASLNFSPDAFAHKTNSMRMSKDSTGDTGDYLGSTMYFVQTLPKAADNTTPSKLESEGVPRPYSPKEERSFFNDF